MIYGFKIEIEFENFGLKAKISAIKKILNSLWQGKFSINVKGNKITDILPKHVLFKNFKYIQTIYIPIFHFYLSEVKNSSPFSAQPHISKHNNIKHNLDLRGVLIE